MLKEVIMDRHIGGDPLPHWVVPIAAANPYKLRQKKTLSEGLKLSDLQSSKLAYLVEPLPLSMFNAVWNFGTLTREDELAYIKKHVHKNCYKYKELRPLIKSISYALNYAHHYIKVVQEKYTVNLRTLGRFSRVVDFLAQDRPPREAVILSLYFTYVCCIDEQRERTHFTEVLAETIVELHDFDQVVERELEAFAAGMEI